MKPDYCKYVTFVYALWDPRPGKEHWFYFGVTIMPRARFDAHRWDPASSAYPRIREIEADGWECEMHILDECDDRNEALRFEHEMITTHAGLLNKARYLSRVFDYEPRR